MRPPESDPPPEEPEEPEEPAGRLGWLAERWAALADGLRQGPARALLMGTLASLGGALAWAAIVWLGGTSLTELAILVGILAGFAVSGSGPGGRAGGALGLVSALPGLALGTLADVQLQYLRQWRAHFLAGNETPGRAIERAWEALRDQGLWQALSGTLSFLDLLYLAAALAIAWHLGARGGALEEAP